MLYNLYLRNPQIRNGTDRRFPASIKQKQKRWGVGCFHWYVIQAVRYQKSTSKALNQKFWMCVDHLKSEFYFFNCTNLQLKLQTVIFKWCTQVMFLEFLADTSKQSIASIGIIIINFFHWFRFNKLYLLKDCCLVSCALS